MTAKVVRLLPKEIRKQMEIVKRARRLLDESRTLHVGTVRELRKLCNKHGVTFESLDV